MELCNNWIIKQKRMKRKFIKTNYYKLNFIDYIFFYLKIIQLVNLKLGVSTKNNKMSTNLNFK